MYPNTCASENSGRNLVEYYSLSILWRKVQCGRWSNVPSFQLPPTGPCPGAESFVELKGGCSKFEEG